VTTVCHVITRLILGGAQENTLLTVRGLKEDPDWEATLVTGPALGPEGDLFDDAAKFGVEPVVIDSLRRAINPWRDLLAFYKLYRHFKSNDYDIVHTHSSKAGILGRWAAYLAGVPEINHTIHGLPFHQFQPWYEFWLYSFLEKYTSFITDKIFTVCDRMTEQAREVGVEPKQGYKTVYSGMELDEFLEVPAPGSLEARAVRVELGFEEDDFVIGKIARLFHLKGHKYCLPAFARVVEKHPEARLLLVGDGILKEKLEKQARELGVREQIVFTGLVPYREIPRMLTAMDCLVHASLREGLPRVIPQAQAAGRPAISYSVDGAPEAIDDGRTGFLVEPEAVDELAEKIELLIEEPQRRKEIAKAAREWVVPRFDWRHMVEEIKEG